MNTANIPIPDLVSTYLAQLLAAQPPPFDSRWPWLTMLRSEALAHAQGLNLPTTRDEEWRFTDISLLSKTEFSPAQSATQLELSEIAHFFIEEAAQRLVFVDGRFAAHLSTPISGLGAEHGIVVSNLSAALATHASTIETHLGQHAVLNSDVFAAHNTAFLQDAAVVLVPRGVVVAAPVHLLFIATQKEVVSTPRCLLVAEADSAVTVIEEYVVLYRPRWQEEAHFTNAVSEIALADQAQVQHVRIQREGSHAFHLAHCAVALGRASHYQSVNLALGARISRYQLSVLQQQEAATCTLDGLTLISGRQVADTHTCIDHAMPHGTSRQLHKCIVGGSAHAVFNGKVMVRPGAQHSDAQQSNRNLLLTNKAHIDTKPQLEIFASDVKCTHGATVGQLDDDGLFYLQSRGLSRAAARNLLTYAFAAELIDRIPVASLRRQLEQTVLEQTTSLS
ncbi:MULTISPECIES: Fe-S cluster assembly protein SufD [unclassified Undibacterium]|uniref:Fe-S cluster assembly protein SufD n=2 Tax=Pseudomonadota TaxID=1224 RepID=UPI002AC8B262|nr:MULTISPECIES: Fe-S cluster assembly protein SufD [unclassified Undibacterium]MEB0138523.1 Fe-S cluster assembly protein SufD [Undibacterium sp. CCC2.1]MEB0173076.1 Fe-S cluster assembly protein SufD [Undibacterium sp. CCC1.1]MEB0176128.1 Fe-S cluster assembly protein SufD [Undibacterium sp. CCC3.4]MEB0215394.1 Fe-S cluster assembly protein SufD [Undibacterium sp. 5I2]WPX42735.1 Fe-S cluster assembly protein SufD [Undibacterium sp. CCC3.4]